jgi:uncharacterized protein (TIGR00369 family)
LRPEYDVRSVSDHDTGHAGRDDAEHDSDDDTGTDADRDGASTTVTAALPVDLHERFVDAAAATDADPETLLVELVRDHVELTESVTRYVRGRDPDPDADANADGADDAAGFEGGQRGAARLLEAPPPIASLLGVDVTDVEPGRAVVSFDASARHASPLGTLHGGVFCDVGDMAMGAAFASTLEPGESFTTVELDAKFRRPVREATLTATAEVVDRGARTGLVDCRVTAEDDLVATLQSVCLVLRD